MFSISSPRPCFMSLQRLRIREHSSSAFLYQWTMALRRVVTRWSQWQMGKKTRSSMMRSFTISFSCRRRLSSSRSEYFCLRDSSSISLICGWLGRPLEVRSSSMMILASKSSAQRSSRFQQSCISCCSWYSLIVTTLALMSSSHSRLRRSTCSFNSSFLSSSRISRFLNSVTFPRCSLQKEQGASLGCCGETVEGVLFCFPSTVNSLTTWLQFIQQSIFKFRPVIPGYMLSIIR